MKISILLKLLQKLRGSKAYKLIFKPILSWLQNYIKILKRKKRKLQSNNPDEYRCKKFSTKYSVRFNSVSQSCPTLCHPMNNSTPGLPVHHHLLSSLKLTSIELVMPSSHLILCRPLLLLPPIPPSIRVFSNESTFHMRWPKYWSFRFSIIPSKEHPGLMSFRMDRLDLLEVQGTLKSLLQHHSSKASILGHWAFFTVQLSHPYTPDMKS